MKCSYCEKEIYEDENFYIISDDICCSGCCKEETYTYYKICDETYEEDEVIPFDTREEAIADYKNNIDAFKHGITEMEHSNAPYKEHYIKRYKEKIKEAQQLIEILKEDEEG